MHSDVSMYSVWVKSLSFQKMERNKCDKSAMHWLPLQRPFAKARSVSNQHDSNAYKMNRFAAIKIYVWLCGMISPFLGAKCECVGGRTGDSGGHGRQRTLHPCQWVGLDEGTSTAQLEQPDLHPISEWPTAQLRIRPAALPRWVSTMLCYHISEPVHQTSNCSALSHTGLKLCVL